MGIVFFDYILTSKNKHLGKKTNGASKIGNGDLSILPTIVIVLPLSHQTHGDLAWMQGPMNHKWLNKFVIEGCCWQGLVWVEIYHPKSRRSSQFFDFLRQFCEYRLDHRSIYGYDLAKAPGNFWLAKVPSTELRTRSSVQIILAPCCFAKADLTVGLVVQ